MKDTVARALLSDLVERGLDTTQGVLCVLDGSKALRRAVRDVLGERPPVHRCIRHKERNVLDHLPERAHSDVRRRLRAAWDDTDHDQALDRLEQLAQELAHTHTHPGAASSLREGMAETLTLTRLGITGSLKRTARNVKRWSSGEMALRAGRQSRAEPEVELRPLARYDALIPA